MCNVYVRGLQSPPRPRFLSLYIYILNVLICFYLILSQVYIFDIMFSFPLGIHLEVEFLDHVVVLILFFFNFIEV